jgi:hypothetical protein
MALSSRKSRQSTSRSVRPPPLSLVNSRSSTPCAGHFGSSAPVAVEIAALRHLLTHDSEDTVACSDSLTPQSRRAFDDVASGRLPLVIKVDKADVIATLLRLKKEVESVLGVQQRWIMSVHPLALLSESH